MISTLVVCDASVALSWLKDEPTPGWVLALVDAAAAGRVGLRVPTLFWLEVSNIVGRGPDLSDEQAFEGLIRLEGLGVVSVEVDRPLRLRALQMARDHGLTTYDGLYLALALDLAATLATLDEDLARAASRLGCRYGDAGPTRIAEAPVFYGTSRPVDHVSLAAIGAYLAELRRSPVG